LIVLFQSSLEHFILQSFTIIRQLIIHESSLLELPLSYSFAIFASL